MPHFSQLAMFVVGTMFLRRGLAYGRTTTSSSRR